jgi:hypothetical protein
LKRRRLLVVLAEVLIAAMVVACYVAVLTHGFDVF